MDSVAPKGKRGGERGSGVHAVGADRRRISRVGVEFVLELELPDGQRVTGVARDIGLGGMFIETIQVPAYGSELTVVLPGSGLKLPSTVRWSSGNGVGVQFGLLGARETHAVAELVEHAKGG